MNNRAEWATKGQKALEEIIESVTTKEEYLETERGAAFHLQKSNPDQAPSNPEQAPTKQPQEANKPAVVSQPTANTSPKKVEEANKPYDEPAANTSQKKLEETNKHAVVSAPTSNTNRSSQLEEQVPLRKYHDDDGLSVTSC